MSCMIMDAKSLMALANTIEALLNCDYSSWGFYVPDSLFRELGDCKTSCTYYADRIYHRLYALNAQAYNGRHADREGAISEEAPVIDGSKCVIHQKPEYREHGFAVCLWHYHFAMLLDFWLYQTAEDATRNAPLRMTMKEFRDSLYCFIVQNSSQYTTTRCGAFPGPSTDENRGGKEHE